MDLRWADMHDLGKVTRLVSSGPFSPRRSWLGFVLSDENTLVLPILLQPRVLEEAVEELGLSPESPLWPDPRYRAPTYGVFFDGEAGRIWAIPEGGGLPDRALLLLPNGERIPNVELRLPIALPRPPSVGLWEMPRHYTLAVHSKLTRT